MSDYADRPVCAILDSPCSPSIAKTESRIASVKGCHVPNQGTRKFISTWSDKALPHHLFRQAQSAIALLLYTP